MGRVMWAALAVVVGCTGLCGADDGAAWQSGSLDKRDISADVDAALHDAGVHVNGPSGGMVLLAISNNKPLPPDCIATWGPYEPADAGDYTRAVAALQSHNWRTVKHTAVADIQSVSLGKGGWTTDVTYDTAGIRTAFGATLDLTAINGHC